MYLRQQIESRKRAVAMVGISAVITELRLIETSTQPPMDNIVQAFWLAADHIPLQHTWPHNETTRPILLLVVEEAHIRQSMGYSPALDSLSNTMPAQDRKEPCKSPRTSTPNLLVRWLRRAN